MEPPWNGRCVEAERRAERLGSESIAAKNLATEAEADRRELAVRYERSQAEAAKLEDRLRSVQAGR